MPGPLSTPGKYLHVRKDGTRETGKTDADHASGKWARHLANKQRRAELNRGGRKQKVPQ